MMSHFKVFDMLEVFLRIWVFVVVISVEAISLPFPSRVNKKMDTICLHIEEIGLPSLILFIRRVCSVGHKETAGRF